MYNEKHEGLNDLNCCSGIAIEKNSDIVRTCRTLARVRQKLERIGHINGMKEK